LHRSSQHPPPSFGDGNSNAHGGDGGSSSPRHDASIRDYDRDLTASVRRQNVKARALYNACIMPHSVILIRHGQSMGNINEDLYSAIPDNAMPLTKLGWEQARAAGRHLRSMLSDRGQSPHFIVSPYTRTVETFHGLASAWCDPDEFRHVRDRDQRLAAWYTRLLEMGLTWHEDPRIREQDFGNYQNSSVIKQAKKDRHRFGAFYYRFPHGESASDVFDRISTFLDSLWRSFDVNQSRVYVIVTHGIAIRVLLARYFRYTISQFSMLANPRNCEMVVLRHDGRGRLQLHGRYELDLKQDDDDEVGRGETRVVGVKFHWRLRVLPPEYIRRVPIRVSYDDDPSATVDHVAQS
jgi:broad specificity phosphatase PhoE